MRLQRLGLAAAGAVATLLLTGGAGALAASNYQPQDNTNVNVNVPVDVPNLGTGALTVSLQEGAQSLAQGTLGTSLGYDFIMVNVNGQNMAGIDPFALYTD